MIASLLTVFPGYGRHDRELSLADQSWAPDSMTVAAAQADFGKQWWYAFNDPMLDTLIAIGEQNNYNAAAAARRISVARQQLGEARSSWFPQIGLSAGYTREGLSGRTDGRSGSTGTASFFNAGANLSWEIDVFGKISRQVSRAAKYVKLSAAEYGGVMLSLDSEIATSYISLLVSRRQLQIADIHTFNQDTILKMVETRYRTGLASKLEVAQARTLYYSTIATVPMLEASIASSYNSLSVLLGVMPDSLPDGLYDEKQLPEGAILPAIGTPADLLRRRPDIAAAENNVDIAASALGIAKSEYLPSLSVSASVGTQAHDIRDMFGSQSLTYSVAPTLSWTLFDGLSRRYATAAAREDLEIQVDNYNLTVLTAVEEVRNALASYSASQRHVERLEKVLENCREEVRLSVELYKQGLTVFSNVVDAQQDYLTYENEMVQAQGNTLISLINIYKALGGGWSE